MEIRDLKDPRDKDHAIRDNQAASIHNFRNQRQVRSNHQSRTDVRTAEYDKLIDREFNRGLST